MLTQRGVSPKQYKVSIGRRVRRKQHRNPTPTAQEAVEPILQLPPNPSPKAVAAYSPRSGIEDAQLRFLIYHYVTVVTAQTLTNVGPRFEWYPLAVRDEAFFHALISSTSSHAAYLQQVELPRNFYFHRGEAIRLLNDRIVEGVRDIGTINTICVFAQQEAFEGRPRTARTHINGLLQLVKAAGGIESFEFDEKTRRHVFFTDLAVALTLSTKPILAPILDISDFKKYFGQPSAITHAYARTFGTRLHNFTNSPLSDQAATTLWGLRNLTQLVEDIHESKEPIDTALASDLQFTDRVEVLERLVHQLWYVDKGGPAQHAIFRTFGWACLIYIYTKLRELPKELGMNPMLAGRIKSALEGCAELNVLLATFQDLLLWQMFVCGKVADERDRPFFASKATKILFIRKLEDAEDIMAATEGFLWPERHISKTPSSSATLSGLESEMIDSDR